MRNQEGRKVKRIQDLLSVNYPGSEMCDLGLSRDPEFLRLANSRSGTPIEIVSKVILRHANLATTQRYFGKVTDLEAMRWIESLHG
jgi:hypothetical protein